MGKLADFLRWVYTTVRYGNELEKALSLAAKGRLKHNEFCKVLLSSDVYVLVQDAAENPQKVILVAEVDGKRIIPIFSSVERINKFIKQKQQYTKITVKEFFVLIKDTEPVVLNPGNTYSKTFSVKEVAGLAR
jgi:hypothetical protein